VLSLNLRGLCYKTPKTLSKRHKALILPSRCSSDCIEKGKNENLLKKHPLVF
jgi:hypothetical protein